MKFRAVRSPSPSEQEVGPMRARLTLAVVALGWLVPAAEARAPQQDQEKALLEVLTAELARAGAVYQAQLAKLHAAEAEAATAKHFLEVSQGRLERRRQAKVNGKPAFSLEELANLELTLEKCRRNLSAKEF